MTRRQLYRADQKNMLLYAIREGLEKGRAETALENGMDPAEVARNTGLPLQQIRAAQRRTLAHARRRRARA